VWDKYDPHLPLRELKTLYWVWLRI
jgi:hypothetical protein